jgi:CRP-like cAMP-binding protein
MPRGGRRSKEDLLSEVPMFSGLNARQLKAVSRLADEIERPPGSVLAQEGELGREFFLILEGEAGIYHGKRKVASLGPGRFFGEISLIDRGPRTATVKAETSLRALDIGVREFSSLLDSIPGMSRRIMINLCARLRECETALSH